MLEAYRTGGPYMHIITLLGILALVIAIWKVAGLIKKSAINGKWLDIIRMLLIIGTGLRFHVTNCSNCKSFGRNSCSSRYLGANCNERSYYEFLCTNLGFYGIHILHALLLYTERNNQTQVIIVCSPHFYLTALKP